MKRNYSYLKDSSFLKTVDEMKVKEQYIKITVLATPDTHIRRRRKNNHPSY